MSKTDPQTPETERILHIRFQRSDEQRIEETLKAIDCGESPEPYFEVVLHGMEDLQTVTRPTNLTLLQTIARKQPESIRKNSSSR